MKSGRYTHSADRPYLGRITSYAEVILGRARSRRYLRLADNPGVGLQHELGSVLYSSVFFDFPFS
jgi:hypothetical protein